MSKDERDTDAGAIPTDPDGPADSEPLHVHDDFAPLLGLSEEDREALKIRIEVFEGPLDLLLHLIRKNEYDIFDIPIAEITEQFLAAIEIMKQLNLSMAGEFLVMAATLMKIKSKMLLPPSEFDEEPDEADPRAQLVRQLLEYQRYKEAAEQLLEMPRLGVDVFARDWPSDESSEAYGPEEVVELNLYDLLEAFGQILRSLPEEATRTIAGESFKVADKMNEILDRARDEQSLLLSDLLGREPTRQALIATFLALLELIKRGLVRIFQAGRFGPIRIFTRVEKGQESSDG